MKRGLTPADEQPHGCISWMDRPAKLARAVSGISSDRRGADVEEFDLFDELSKLPAARRGIGVNPGRLRTVLVIVETMESISSATKPDVSSDR